MATPVKISAPAHPLPPWAPLTLLRTLSPGAWSPSPHSKPTSPSSTPRGGVTKPIKCSKNCSVHSKEGTRVLLKTRGWYRGPVGKRCWLNVPRGVEGPGGCLAGRLATGPVKGGCPPPQNAGKSPNPAAWAFISQGWRIVPQNRQK